MPRYKAAIVYINNDDVIIQSTGGIKGYGSFPRGSINVIDGYGNAVFEITVLGNKQDVDIVVNLQKEPNGSWMVTGLSQ